MEVITNITTVMIKITADIKKILRISLVLRDIVNIIFKHVCDLRRKF